MLPSKPGFKYTPNPNKPQSTTNLSNPKISNTPILGTNEISKHSLFTLGYGGLSSSEQLLLLLKHHKVNLLIDVRISPACGFCVDFDSGISLGDKVKGIII
jgi:hypothetical protein